MLDKGQRKLTMFEEALVIDGLVARCVMRDGTIAAENTCLLTAEDVFNLTRLANRLNRMAPHEERIRRIVTENK